VKEKKLKLLLAARLSKLQQDGQQGMGIETQDERSREWAEREGHTVIGVAADTKSGTVPPWKRPNLRPWVTKSELMTEYDGILAYKNDRLSRGAWEDETEIRRWAMQHGKVLIIADGPWWPPRHEGDRWAWEANAAQAHKEWEEGRERSIRQRTKLMELGKLVDRLPWGYMSVGPRYDHHPETTEQGREYAPLIFEKVRDGMPLAKIADWLDSEGVRTNGKMLVAWSPKTVLRMVRNPIYYGSKQDAKGVEVMQVPALVDAALWEAANKALSTTKRGRRGPASGKPALLTSVLFCQRCHLNGIESPMRRIKPIQGYHYRCWGTGQNPKGCGNMVPLDATDVLAINMLSLASDPWTEIQTIPGTSYEVDRAKIRLQMRELSSRGLSREAFQAESDRLWDVLEAIPTDTEPKVETVETGETVGEHWVKLDREGRRAMMLEDVRFYADNPRACWVHNHQLAGPVLRIESRLFKIPTQSVA